MKRRKKLKNLSTILFIPDTHAPYHDERAFSLVLEVAKDIGIDIVVILGDFFDFYCVSSHSKDPDRANKLDWEISEGNKLIDRVSALGASRKIFIAGNHENRLDRYIAANAPELYSLLTIQKSFKLKERGFEYVPYKSDAKVGKLHVTHDCGNAGRYAAFKALDTYQSSVVIGHTHRLSYLVEGSARGKHHVSAMFGWLGDASKADYMHRVKAARDWSLGFGIGYLDNSNDYIYLVPVPIVEYTCVVNGKLYKG